MPTLAELGEQLGLTPAAAAMAVHRLRKQFRAAVKAKISQTVEDQDEIRAELDYLVQALSLACDSEQQRK